MLKNDLNLNDLSVNSSNIENDDTLSPNLPSAPLSKSSSCDSSLPLKSSKLNSPTLSNGDTETISLKLYDRLIEELKCPGCAIPMRAPITLCNTGHSVCEKCVARDEKCPLCKHNFTAIRSFTVEALCAKAQFRCANVSTGCNARLPLDLLDWHEKQCQHKAIKCFMGRVWGNCTWVGQESSWINHLETDHTDKVFNEQTVEIEWHLGDQQTSLMSYYVFNCYDETFNLYQINDKEKLRILWTMASCSGLPGCRDKNFRFAYEIQIYQKNDESKVISQRFPCHHELDKDLLQEGTCVAVPLEQISNFITHENMQRVIYYRVNIFKIDSRNISNRSSTETSPRRFAINYKPMKFIIGNDQNISPEMIVTKNIEGQEEKIPNARGDSDSETDSELDAFVTEMLRKRLSREFMTPNSARKFWDSNYAYGSMQSLEVVSNKLDSKEGIENEHVDNMDKLRKKSLIKNFRKSLKYFRTDKDK